MAAPTNSGESYIVTEDFCLSLSPLLSPRWSPPRPFLLSSNSMVMQYQGSDQSRDDPPQNQEHDDIVDQAHQGFEESNMGIEESMEMTTCFYFPPSPANFPLYRPMLSAFFVSSEQENISLALSCQHILEDKSGALHVINEVECKHIVEQLFNGGAPCWEKNYCDLHEMAMAAGVLPKGLESLMKNIIVGDTHEREVTLRRINWLEQHNEAIVDQPVYELVFLVQQLIRNRGGELDVIFGEGVLMLNGLEHRDGQGPPTTPEALPICQAKVSSRVWLGQDGQWAAELCYKFNRLNIGSFTTMQDAISAYEMVSRMSGWVDLTSFPGLLEKENKSKLPLQLPPLALEEKPGEGFGLVCYNATGNDEIEAVGTGSEQTGDCVMADQAQLNSRCLGKRKIKENNPWRERRNKKTNGVRIAIPLEDILQIKGMWLKDATNHLEVSRSTFKRACREYGIERWPPRNENKLVSQSCRKESPTVVDQEGIQQLYSDQALTATVDTNNVVLKVRCINDIIVKFPLSWPWKMAELEQQVEKRLKLKSGTYYIKYKDEENDIVCVLCDEDLQNYISNSRPMDTSSIEIFLVPK